MTKTIRPKITNLFVGFTLPALGTASLTACVSVWCLLAFNHSLWQKLLEWKPVQTFEDVLFVLSFGLLAFIVTFIFLTPLTLGSRLSKSLMSLILILSSASAYFVDRFGILIDKTMIRNVFATNATESLELVSSGLIFQVVLLGVVPALLLQRWPLKKQSFRQIFAHRALIIMALLVMLGGIAAIFYQPHAALLRNHREVRHMLSPVNMLSGVGSLVSEVTRKPLPYEAIAAGVRLGPHRSSIASNPEGMTNRQSRPTLLVLVVGETARAKNFGLNHYARATTPKLQSIPEVVAFDRVVACGTSTAISVPCMFSDLTREEFSIRRARARDNLLDVLEKAGFKVAWFDNNTSCNGVCRDRKEIRADQDTSTALCAANTPCMDGAIFNKVWDQIEEIQQDTVVVIHMLGSHGPGYHLRYPKEYEKFTPVCRETDFSLCGINEIVNAYDNSILYSDYLLAETIENLERRNDSLDSALLFISDHGESLGEKGLFLHAIPYSVAPREQLEVPMVFWMSDGFGDHMNLMPECIRHASHKSLSHDHLFHSILGLVDIELPAKRAELDVFSLCRRS